jgi:WD40 repeat protein
MTYSPFHSTSIPFKSIITSAYSRKFSTSSLQFLLTCFALCGLMQLIAQSASADPVRTFEGHLKFVKAVAYSQNGKYALSGGEDRTVKLWDIESGKEIRTFRGHLHWVLSVAFSPNGKYALSGSRDDTLKFWDVQTGQEAQTLAGHQGMVRCVAFSPNGRYILSGSEDNTLKLWDLSF